MVGTRCFWLLVGGCWWLLIDGYLHSKRGAFRRHREGERGESCGQAEGANGRCGRLSLFTSWKVTCLRVTMLAGRCRGLLAAASSCAREIVTWFRGLCCFVAHVRVPSSSTYFWRTLCGLHVRMPRDSIRHVPDVPYPIYVHATCLLPCLFTPVSSFLL